MIRRITHTAMAALPVCLAISLLTMACAAGAKPAPADNRVIAGWVEKVRLAASGDTVKAKLDTGATTSSINAVDIAIFRRDNEDWVRFTLKYENARHEPRAQPLERPLIRKIQIKEHAGENDRRAVVMLGFCFAGRWHEDQFSLVDRSKFVYPVLLGRRFLADATLIDPAATFITEPNCPAEPLP